jgi:hypothetical protein
MLVTFLTVLSTLYLVFVVGWLTLIGVVFVRLTPIQQRRTTITVSSWTVVLGLASIAFLLARLFE